MSLDESKIDEVEVEEFAGRLFEAALGAMELINVDLGSRLGLYEVMSSGNWLTPADLAAQAGINERYAREWLEQQTVAGIVDVEDASAEPEQRRFSLPASRAHVLLDKDSEAYMAAFAAFIPLAGTIVDKVADAFRTGGGVPYADYGIHDLQAAWTRPVFKAHLTSSWLPAVPGLEAKLRAGTAQLAEIGCGDGLAAVQIADDFPGTRVVGFDLDDASIAAARKAAADAGVSHQVTFEAADAGSLSADDRYDLVYCIEMLHDVSDPVGVLRTMRSLRASDGEVLVVDERTADTFDPQAGEMERLFYAFSTLHCLPAGMTEPGSAATGTVIRQSTVEDYAKQAGFSGVEVLNVEHPQFRLYRLIG